MKNHGPRKGGGTVITFGGRKDPLSSRQGGGKGGRKEEEAKKIKSNAPYKEGLTRERAAAAQEEKRKVFAYKRVAGNITRRRERVGARLNTKRGERRGEAIYFAL